MSAFWVWVDICSFNFDFRYGGLARTSQEYHQRYLRPENNFNWCINFIKMLFNILKIKPIFGDFVIWYFMLFDAGLSIVCNRFWVHIWCWFDILKYRAALVPALTLSVLYISTGIVTTVFNQWCDSVTTFHIVCYPNNVADTLLLYILYLVL